MFAIDSSMRQHALYADICGGSLERKRQTTVQGAILVDLRACIRCRIGWLKIPHVACNKTEKKQFQLVAL